LADNKPLDILALAKDRADAAHAVRGDLLDVLFPRTGSPPSELLQAQVKLKMQALVRGIEQRLVGDNRSRAESWEALAKAALLREAALVDFIMARIAEQNVRQLMVKASAAAFLEQLPATLIGSDSQRLAELASALLAADHMQAADDSHLLDRLPSELLHLLCWRVVAALNDGKVDGALVASAKSLLAAHRRETDPFAIAEKLVFFLGPDHHAALTDPARAGFSLFVAALARDSGLGCDTVVQLISDESPAPLLMLAKVSGITGDRIGPFLTMLHGSVPGHMVDAFSALDPVEARALVAQWAGGEG
jgi:hypothetical protein